MALPSQRVEYRIALSHVDRGVDVTQAVVLAQHPSETERHLTLRVLAWCLLYDERLQFGPGLSDGDAADLWGHDLTGRLATWVECGNTTAEKVRKVVQHHHDAAVHVVLDDAARTDELEAELRAWRGTARRAGAPVNLWRVDEAVVEALSEVEGRRRRWMVTVVGGHLYVDENGRVVDGEIEHRRV
jgi:uncharacterized protein YaeQ